MKIIKAVNVGLALSVIILYVGWQAYVYVAWSLSGGEGSDPYCYPLAIEGRGTIAFPAGAYRDNPTAGEAGFQIDLQPTRSMVVMKLRVDAANLDFSGGTVDYSGGASKRSGHGSLNGQSGYLYDLTVLDGGLPRGDGQDRLRFEIWDGNHKQLIYDSLPGVRNTVPPPILGGSIEVNEKETCFDS
jgi:hypothetical protein